MLLMANCVGAGAVSISNREKIMYVDLKWRIVISIVRMGLSKAVWAT